MVPNISQITPKELPVFFKTFIYTNYESKHKKTDKKEKHQKK
jgi:hypothetical protein